MRSLVQCSTHPMGQPINGGKPPSKQSHIVASDRLAALGWRRLDHGRFACSECVARFESNVDTRVVNLRYHHFDLYIGRENRSYNLSQSQWFNPYKLSHHDIFDCLILYIDKLKNDRHLLEQVPLLKGVVLGCWCKPHTCHGDILAELANSWENIGQAVCWLDAKIESIKSERGRQGVLF